MYCYIAKTNGQQLAHTLNTWIEKVPFHMVVTLKQQKEK